MLLCVRALKRVQTLCSHSKEDVGGCSGDWRKKKKKKGESSHGAFSEMAGRGGKKCIPKVEHHVMTVSEEKL